jgi:hypothetical protein
MGADDTKPYIRIAKPKTALNTEMQVDRAQIDMYLE